MKYNKQQRLIIGRRIYEGDLSRYQAAEAYGVSEQTARDYMRFYRDVQGLPPKQGNARPALRTDPLSLKELELMSREELIGEVVKARSAAAWLENALRGEVKSDKFEV